MKFSKADILRFLTKLGDDGYSPNSTINAQKAAVTKILSALSKEEQGNLNHQMDISSLFVRFENKAKHELNSASLRTYEARFKTAYNGFIEWNKDPSNYRPKTRRKKSRMKTESDSSSQLSAPNTKDNTEEYRLNATTLVKYPLITERIRGSIEIPEKLSASDSARLIPLITQIIKSHSLGATQELNQKDNKEQTDDDLPF